MPLRSPTAGSGCSNNPDSCSGVGMGARRLLSAFFRGCFAPRAFLPHQQDGAGPAGLSLLGVFCWLGATAPGPGRDGAMSQPWQACSRTKNWQSVP